MAYTYEYFYTVQVETSFMSQTELNSAGSNTDKTLQTLFGEYVMTHTEQNLISVAAGTVDTYGVYNGPASTAGPYATQIHATKDNKFRYCLRFYLKRTNLETIGVPGANPFEYFWLNEAAVKNIKITPASTNLSVGDV